MVRIRKNPEKAVELAVKGLIGDLIPLIKEELNIKEVKFADNLNDYMNLSVKPNFKEVGKTFGPLIKEFQTKLEALSNEDILSLQNGNVIKMNLGNEEYEINSSMVDIRISSKEGFNVGTENNNFIILETKLTQELLDEGLARETISKIQQIRKNNNFDVADRINVYFESDSDYGERIKSNLELIMGETLALKFEQAKGLDEEYDINEYKVKFKVEKA